MKRGETVVVLFEHRITKLDRVPGTIAEQVVALANQSRPRVLSYREIADEIRFAESRAGRQTYLDPAVVGDVIRRDRPQLIEERREARRVLREQLRPKPLRFDGRAIWRDEFERARRGVDDQVRRRLIARAEVFVLDAEGRAVPCYTLDELGRRFGPRGLVLSSFAVRRVILSAPHGRELLAERLRARRAAAKPAKAEPEEVRRPGRSIKPESARRRMRRVLAREAYRLREITGSTS